MKRHSLAVLLVVMAGAFLSTALAQVPMRAADDAVRRIVVLVGSAENLEGQIRVKAFQESLRSRGWTEGRNAQVHVRWAAASPDRMQTLAKEAVLMKPDVIFAEATPVVAALLKETRAIPIVFVNVSDPVGSGFVASLSHPGGTVTGFISNEPTLAGKWLQVLKEIAPQLRRARLIFNPKSAPYVEPFVQSFESAGRAFAVEAVAVPINSPEQLDSIISGIAHKRDDGIVVMADIFMIVHQQRIADLAATHRVMTVCPFGFFARNGCLVAYGVDIVELFRNAAVYVDRIVRGESPANLPVQRATKFELVVNRKTAKALGVAIPRELAARADEVIE